MRGSEPPDVPLHIQGGVRKKPAAGFPARAFICDAELMLVICPTCQTPANGARTSRSW